MKKALITWGGWDGHEPEACGRIFESILKEKGYEVVFTDNMDCYTDKALMDSLNLIVPVWTMSEISKEQWTGLKDTVLAGCGIAGWHGGMGDSFRSNVEYQFMVGGQWVAHPGGVIDYSIQITSDDPIVSGFKEFKMHSEQYYMHVDPNNEVLATTTFKGNQEGIEWIAGTVMPVAWKRHFGKARVFYASFGHVAADFETAGLKEIMTRGMLWASS
ncbi:ThuA domain-containing protein [Oceanispirochaeta sp.]|jgi:type 1 glutamine amidotransferase|uniref:ThuA domain-containing protein n=1 Tax=Oceanispirochaeta sp. TaxID=2035350 RepID=UPI002604B1DF|nr:ThuA domain-containing protein [Oceanispirochaeta sp.]MDA3957650.1 ThuA domain-containing protein [Oceanispirochaeta sp.]